MEAVRRHVLEDLVSADAGQQRATARRFQQRLVYVGVERPEEAEAAKHLRRNRSDRVQLRARLDPDPVVESERRDDTFLPRRLVRLLELREPERGWYRCRKPFAAGDCGGKRENARGVPPAREADEARRPPKRRKDDRLESRERSLDFRRRLVLWLDSEHEP